MSSTDSVGARDALLHDFFARLRARRVSPHTLSAYQRDLTQLRDFLQGRGVGDWGEVRVTAAQGFAAKLRQAGLAARSIQRMLCAARAFYRYLLERGAVADNPFAGIAAPKVGRGLPTTLSVDELDGLLGKGEGGDGGDGVLAVRDYAILELFYSCGLRLSEVVSLSVGGVDFQQGEVRVTGKGNKERVVPLGSKAAGALQRWLGCRGRLAAEGEAALFVNQKGRRLGARGIQYRLNHFAQKHGLGRRLHPHMLRHSFASHVLASSGDLRAVQEMLGHENIATTQIYTHLDFQHLAKVYDAAHPRAKRVGGDGGRGAA